MRCRVVRMCAVDGEIFKPGLYPFEGVLRDNADELVKTGWLIVFDFEPDAVRLATPESGLQLALRG